MFFFLSSQYKYNFNILNILKLQNYGKMYEEKLNNILASISSPHAAEYVE